LISGKGWLELLVYRGDEVERVIVCLGYGGCYMGYFKLSI